MTKILAALVALVAGGATLLGTASSASAYNGYDVAASDVTFASDSCFSGSVTVSGFGNRDSGYDVEVLAPDGSWVDADYVFDDDSTTLRPRLCFYTDPVGRYSVQVDGTEVGSFSVARPALTARAVAKGTKQARVQGQLLLRGQPLAGRRVALQHREYGTWFTKRTLTTNAGGYVAAQCPKRKSTKGCAGSFRFAHNGVAASSAFGIPRRR